jgi:hypothetical protein
MEMERENRRREMEEQMVKEQNDKGKAKETAQDKEKPDDVEKRK